MTVTVKCAFCGKEKQVKSNELGKRKNFFCNRVCYGGWRSSNQKGENNSSYVSGKIKRICKNCGVEYEIPPSYVRNKEGFHSLECYQEWRKKESDKNKIEIECCICHKIKKVWASRFKKGKDKTCSKKCEARLKAIIRVGKNNPNWREGTSFLPYCHKFNKKRKVAVREFFNNLCICCGKHVSENIVGTSQKELSVHHIDHDKDQGCSRKPFNLVPLCNSCHGKEQGDVGGYTKYINKTLDEGFKWGIWSKSEYEQKVMY